MQVWMDFRRVLIGVLITVVHLRPDRSRDLTEWLTTCGNVDSRGRSWTGCRHTEVKGSLSARMKPLRCQVSHGSGSGLPQKSRQRFGDEQIRAFTYAAIVLVGRLSDHHAHFPSAVQPLFGVGNGGTDLVTNPTPAVRRHSTPSATAPPGRTRPAISPPAEVLGSPWRKPLRGAIMAP